MRYTAPQAGSDRDDFALHPHENCSMKLKRLLIMASIAANAGVLVAPGAWFVWVHIGTFPGATAGRDVSLERDFGVLALAFGTINILCIWCAVALDNRRSRSAAVHLGYVTCGFVAATGYLFGGAMESVLLFYSLGATAILTARCLRVFDRAKNQEGHCPHCDYDLAGLSSDICPECGGNRHDAPGSPDTEVVAPAPQPPYSEPPHFPAEQVNEPDE